MSAHKRRAAPSAHLRRRKDQGQQKSPWARFWKNARSGLTVLVALTIITVTVAPASAAEADAIDIEAVDQFVLDSLARAGIPGAAIAITSGADVLHVRGYGHDSAQTPVTEHTPFRIASLSKAFTSLAVMQLVDAGKLALDDTVYAHLPEFRIADPRGADITIRQLLNQTSGLADRKVPDLSRPQPTTLADAATSLHSARLVADPGTEFNYHNPNYQVAARLVEVVSGESFDQYLRDHVFQPAGMDESLNTSIDNDAGNRPCRRPRPRLWATDRVTGTGRLRRRCRRRRVDRHGHGAVAHPPGRRWRRGERNETRFGAQHDGDAHQPRTLTAMHSAGAHMLWTEPRHASTTPATSSPSAQRPQSSPNPASGSR